MRGPLPVESSAPQTRLPSVDETGRFGSWQVIGSSSLGAVGGIVADPQDSAVWFTDVDRGLMRVAMDAVVTDYPLRYRGQGFEPFDLVKGADGRFYMGTGQSISAIGAFAPGAPGRGTLKVYSLPGDDFWQGGGFALGSDGNVWFTEAAHISSISPAGIVTQYAYPSGANGNSFAPVVADADGNIWFTEHLDGVPPGIGIVAEMVPSTHKITEYNISKHCATPGTLTRGIGTLLFATCGTAGPNTLLEVTKNGKATAYTNPYGTAFGINHTTLGPDGAYYITPFVTKEFLVRFDPATKRITTVHAPAWVGGFGFGPLTRGPDDNLWSVDLTGAILVDLFNIVTVTPATLHLKAGGGIGLLTATYHGTKVRSLSARSSNTGVVRVTQGSGNAFFAVAAAPGYAQIVVHDPIGNRFTVEVTVR